MRRLRRWICSAVSVLAVACNPLMPSPIKTAVRARVGSGRLRKVLELLSWPLLGVRVGRATLRVVSPDLHRSVGVWGHILPIFTGYMWTKYSCDIGARVFGMSRARVEARWAARHEHGGQQVFDMINAVRGYYVKTGQVLATKREFVPEPWARRLARLWDDTPPRPWRSVRASVCADLAMAPAAQQLDALAQGEAVIVAPMNESAAAPKHWAPSMMASLFGPWMGAQSSTRSSTAAMTPQPAHSSPSPQATCQSPRSRQTWHDTSADLHRFFQWVDTQPLASASIAQVHSARLSPEMLRLLVQGGWTHGPDVVVKVQHADVQRRMGADLRNMGRIARFLNHVLPFDVTPAVQEMQKVIPKEFDFVREARLMDELRRRLAHVSPAICVPQPALPLCGPGIIVMQRMPGTPLTALLAAAHKGDAAARHACIRCLTPVLDAYGHMILVDGLFHADPHPGNMVLQPDGRVALLDFGQCKALAADERHALCCLYSGLARRDLRAALPAVRQFGLNFGTAGPRRPQEPESGSANDASSCCGSVDNARAPSLVSRMYAWATGGAAGVAALHLGEGVDPEGVMKMLFLLFDTRWVAEGAYSFGGGDVVEGAPLAAFPGPLYLVCRAILILRGICAAMELGDMSVVDMWAKHAAAGLRQRPEVSEAQARANAVLDSGCLSHVSQQPRCTI